MRLFTGHVARSGAKWQSKYLTSRWHFSIFYSTGSQDSENLIMWYFSSKHYSHCFDSPIPRIRSFKKERLNFWFFFIISFIFPDVLRQTSAISILCILEGRFVINASFLSLSPDRSYVEHILSVCIIDSGLVNDNFDQTFILQWTLTYSTIVLMFLFLILFFIQIIFGSDFLYFLTYYSYNNS